MLESAELSTNNLLGIKDLNPEDIHLIFHWTKKFKEIINRPIRKVPSLRDITVANLFFENSILFVSHSIFDQTYHYQLKD